MWEQVLCSLHSNDIVISFDALIIWTCKSDLGFGFSKASEHYVCRGMINLVQLFISINAWNVVFIHFVCSPGSPGGSTAETCQPCPPGQYCQQRGMAEPSGQCAEGYYCPKGQISERPQQHICSVGHYCEKVSHITLVLKLLSLITVEYCMRCHPRSALTLFWQVYYCMVGSLNVVFWTE